MSRIVGVAGLYCAGKSLAAEILRSRGYEEIDVDSLGHYARERMAREVEEAFGTTDRRELGRIVFSDAEQLRRLEAIVHPWMKDEVGRRVDSLRREGKDGVINAALLFPMGLHSFCDKVLWITASLPVRFLRARRRDSLTPCGFVRRLRSQRKLYPQKVGENVDISRVANNGNRRRFERRILDLL
ncbi:dephospho-CoA kinase [Marispirochaeta aestuarii]|uniref:dephospho-CoA kinase n=1 Tax=Marispirochaeta aestuarii TaxID=1963862 RepID=UPI0029C9901B|nr:dephospho-CoA kinase [Marispirochaeta aestuarii]